MKRIEIRKEVILLELKSKCMEKIVFFRNNSLFFSFYLSNFYEISLKLDWTLIDRKI